MCYENPYFFIAYSCILFYNDSVALLQLILNRNSKGRNKTYET